MIVNIEQFKPCLEQIVGAEALRENELFIIYWIASFHSQ